MGKINDRFCARGKKKVLAGQRMGGDKKKLSKKSKGEVRPGLKGIEEGTIAYWRGLKFIYRKSSWHRGRKNLQSTRKRIGDSARLGGKNEKPNRREKETGHLCHPRSIGEENPAAALALLSSTGASELPFSQKRE